MFVKKKQIYKKKSTVALLEKIIYLLKLILKLFFKFNKFVGIDI